ncbi:MAG: hypothetical protein AAGD14_13570 [Planctomycetota bacterium]
MRWILGWALLAMAAWTMSVWTDPAYAQDGEPKAGNDSEEQAPPTEESEDEGAEEDGEKKAEEEPKEPPAFVLSDKDRKKVDKELRTFLVPSKKGRAMSAKGIRKLGDKPIDGHSFMEDVPALSDIANRSRVFGSKVGRAGSLLPVKVPPAVHGFPGEIGTVTYWVRLPKGYKDKKLWPVIFCLPDTRAFPDTSKYIKDVWLKSKTIQNEFILAVPTPAAKGKQWRTDPKSYARAMIALRHLVGTFEGSRKTAGPASDYMRVFIDGGDVAAAVAARFSEMFAGVILRGSDGNAGRIKLRNVGGINGLPAYAIVKKDSSKQQSFAGAIKTANDATAVVVADDVNAVDPEAAATWIKELAPRTQLRQLEYTIHNSSFQRHHWINVLRYDGSRKDPANFRARADRIANVITIENDGVSSFEVSLNDAIVDLNRDVTIKVVEDDKEMIVWNGKVERDLGFMLTELLESNQPWRIYPARIAVDMPSARAKWAEEEAKRKAAEAAQEEAEKKGTSARFVGESLDR